MKVECTGEELDKLELELLELLAGGYFRHSGLSSVLVLLHTLDTFCIFSSHSKYLLMSNVSPARLPPAALQPTLLVFARGTGMGVAADCGVPELTVVPPLVASVGVVAVLAEEEEEEAPSDENRKTNPSGSELTGAYEDEDCGDDGNANVCPEPSLD